MILCAFDKGHPFQAGSKHSLIAQTDPTIINLIVHVGFHQTIQTLPTSIRINRHMAELLVERIGKLYRQTITALVKKQCTYCETVKRGKFNFAEAVAVESSSNAGMLYHVSPQLIVSQLQQETFVCSHLVDLISPPAINIIDPLLFKTISNHTSRQLYTLFMFYGKILRAFQHEPQQEVTLIYAQNPAMENFVLHGNCSSG